MQAHTTAIVLAAGQGKRMQAKVHKQYLLIEDKPVLYYSFACHGRQLHGRYRSGCW